MEDESQHEAWRTWFDRYGRRLLLYARQLTRTAQDAEDVVQEAFVRYWRHQRHLPGEPAALLFASVRRAACDWARREERRQRREEKSDSPAAESLWWQVPEAERERAADLARAMQQLPVEQREILVLKIWGELTFEQIGSQLELSPHTAASRYRQALQHLRKHLLASIP